MSDLSSFADWEAHNRSLEQEQVSQEAQRQRELGDLGMGMDSSNDERNYASYSASDNEQEVEERHVGYGVREVFAQVDEVGSLDGESEEDGGEVMGGAEMELVSSTMGKIGWRPRGEGLEMDSNIQDQHPDFVDPPSSQPRYSSSNSPERRVEPRHESRPRYDRPQTLDSWTVNTLKYGTYFSSKSRATVEHYARSHPFFTDANIIGLTLNGDEMEEYEKDIYKFARAAGMGKQTARVEVMRAVAAWERHTGLGKGLVLDAGEESDFEVERGPKLRNAEDYYPKPVAVQTLHISTVGVAGAEKKRKHSEMETGSGKKAMARVHNEPEDRDSKRLKRKEKKLKRKEKKARQTEKRGRNKQPKAALRKDSIVLGTESIDPLMEEEPERTQPTCHQVLPVYTTTSAPNKQRSKPGPKTSSYFPKVASSATVDRKSSNNNDSQAASDAPGEKSKRKKRKRNQNRGSGTSAQAPAASQAMPPPSQIQGAHPIPSGPNEEPAELQAEKQLRTQAFLDTVHSADAPFYEMDNADATDLDSADIPKINMTSAPNLSKQARRRNGIREEAEPHSYEKKTAEMEENQSTINSSQQLKRRDRGRRNSKISRNSSDIATHVDTPGPLAELYDTNSQDAKLQRRDSERHARILELEQNISGDEGLKVYHS
jgi:hypothetical protein